MLQIKINNKERGMTKHLTLTEEQEAEVRKFLLVDSGPILSMQVVLLDPRANQIGEATPVSENLRSNPVSPIAENDGLLDPISDLGSILVSGREFRGITHMDELDAFSREFYRASHVHIDGKCMKNRFGPRCPNPEIVHRVKDGFSYTSCCNKNVFELPRTDKITVRDSLVTCPTYPKPHIISKDTYVGLVFGT